MKWVKDLRPRYGLNLMTENLSRILIIEDEKNLGSTLLERFDLTGYQATWAQTGADARFEIDKRKYDLALVDVGLPDETGFEVASYIRKRQPGTALVFLTAMGTPEDRVRGLELGAEDYIVKPFHLKELQLRVRNALKRSRYLSSNLQESIQIGNALVDFQKFEVKKDSQVFSLTHKECALLKLLVERRGNVVSREEILNHVWGEEEFPTPRTVDNFILRLRKLIEFDSENPEVIKNIRGVGYQLQ